MLWRKSQAPLFWRCSLPSLGGFLCKNCSKRAKKSFCILSFLLSHVTRDILSFPLSHVTRDVPLPALALSCTTPTRSLASSVCVVRPPPPSLSCLPALPVPVSDPTRRFLSVFADLPPGIFFSFFCFPFQLPAPASPSLDVGWFPHACRLLRIPPAHHDAKCCILSLSAVPPCVFNARLPLLPHHPHCPITT